MNKANTPFSFIYDSFLNKTTDDMYLELDELETYRLLSRLLLGAVQRFEFPQKNLRSYTLDGIDTIDFYNGVESDHKDVIAYIYAEGCFHTFLTDEEINILSTYMVVEWLGQQLASVENVRMKYAGSDWKMSSQANHMAKILSLKKDWEREGFHLQRLYSRRKVNEEGIYQSTFSDLMKPIRKK